ncbi:nucleotidyl transferase AbiEii/AbiGii toxin family protein [Microtetraspora fusca]|uniref:nucleotidyl transferase AbiEii/AbiGii toxin family protein n=1 Tax=Microtetraspora fusca TaxID=1997 RepID=UPI000830EECC|nr:nucleotidyl transferase AbiEii/AbiGii toxin family protein [Microtetraspora fusca]
METRSDLPYASPRALDAALTARFKKLSAARPHSISQIRRQFAYDRALARCFTGPNGDRWVLKGGISLLALLRDARHSADLDLAADARDTAQATQLLGESLQQDLGDHFSFQLGHGLKLIEGIEGVRVPVVAFLGPRPYERFHLDVVIGATVTGSLEEADPLVPVGIPGLRQPKYQLYPLCDTLADKVCAIMERHGDRPSTRFRDLADIVLIARSRSIEAAKLSAALTSERLLRKSGRHTSLDVPDQIMWRAGYAKVSGNAPGLYGYRDLEAALSLARALVDPVLDGSMRTGRWNPTALRWEP